MSLLEELKKEKSQNNGSNLLNELKQERQKSLSGFEVLTQAVQNLPSSAAQLVSDVTMPIRHPIQTVQSLASLGRGVFQLATPGEQPDEATAKAVGQFFANRYGSLEGFKNAFAKDPLGIVSDVSLVLMGGGGIAAKVPGLTGQIAQKVGKVGTAIDPVLASGKAISATTKGVGKVIAPLLGTTTGSDLPGYLMDLDEISSETQCDESTASATTGNFFSWGTDPDDSGNVIGNVNEMSNYVGAV